MANKLKSKLTTKEFMAETGLKTKQAVDYYKFGDARNKIPPILFINEDYHWNGGELQFLRSAVNKVLKARGMK